MDHHATIKNIIGSLKSAQSAHPEIDFAGHETSIAKRVMGNLKNCAEKTAQTPQDRISYGGWYPSDSQR